MNLIPSLFTAAAQVLLLISYNHSFDRKMQTELKFVKQLATGLGHGARGDVVKHSLKSFPFRRKTEPPPLLLYLLNAHICISTAWSRFRKAEGELLPMVDDQSVGSNILAPRLPCNSSSQMKALY
jgi:hypothetical protein